MTTIAEAFESMDYGPAPESDDQVQAWLDAHKRSFGMYIGGKWTKHDPKRAFQSRNPATGEVLASGTLGSARDLEAAVHAAREAFGPWSALSGHERARHLYALTREIQRNSRLLSVLETMDNGKPIRESRDVDVPLLARHFSYHAGWAQLMDTELADYEPLGVVGQIVPWNFPLLMLAWKIVPAIAMGNTVVLKPAEITSLSALLFAELCDAAGIPAGVVNIVTGKGSDIGTKMLQHPGIAKIAFTGSTEVGRSIRTATAGSGKRLSLELGGKSPFVVFEDADLDAAVEGVVDAIFFNQGQVCCAGSRMIVQEGIAERFEAKLRARMDTLRVGDPLDKSTDIGAVVSETQLETVRRYVQVGIDEGASCYQPPLTLTSATSGKGTFHPPTLLTGVSAASTVAQEEIFGPVMVSMTFRTPAEAVALANNTRYGLAATVWTEDVNVALDIAGQIKAGVVWINSTNLFDAATGFGGYRESGYGREGGKEGLHEYIRVRAHEVAPAPARKTAGAAKSVLAISAPVDRTPKLYVGGKQARPDSGYSLSVQGHDGRVLGEVGRGNRKDIRNAVEAAHAGAGWSGQNPHNRSQVLYYIGENLSARTDEFAARLHAMTGCGSAAALAEVHASVDALFTYAAWADKYDGAVHRTPYRAVTLAFNEPVGVIGVVCPDDAPLLAPVSLVAAALALGNRVIVVPSSRYPLAVTDLYQVLDTSDVPGGAVNIVTGESDELAKVLALHDDVEAIWYFGSQDGAGMVEKASAGNLKRTWTVSGAFPWFSQGAAIQGELLREASQVKNVFVPFGA